MTASKKESVPQEVRTLEGEALRGLLKTQKMQQQDLAEAADIGSKSYLNQILTGLRPLNIEVAASIAAVLGVRIDSFSKRLADQIRQAHEHVERTYPGHEAEPAPMPAAAEPTRLLRFEAARSERASAWPFRALSPAEYAEISEGGRSDLEQLARGMYMEARRLKTGAG
jgi:transcriptional regulator with XRE-family HTH domain